MVNQSYNKPNNIIYNTYAWNFISSFLFGFQSLFLLMILTRTVSLEYSGMFMIAYASASLFLFIGKYGVRNYQVSDVNYNCTFGDYKVARFLSASLMIISSIVYVLISSRINGYSLEKSLIIIFTCLMKVPDAIEDVYFGEYQRKGRLDIAAKIQSIRLGITILSLSIFVITTKNLLLSLIIATITAFVAMVFFLKNTANYFVIDFHSSWKSIRKIFLDCFPLFAGLFLAQYINNAAKYAIDAQLSDEKQACYGFIAMPVFVIGLLNNVIFNPVIHTMAEYWTTNNTKKFIKLFLKQILIIIIITMICIIGGFGVGIPILSFIYNANLSGYKNEFMILLLGGGFLALSGLLSTVITIMRFQYSLLIGYAFIAITAFISSNKIVCRYGMIGASWLYTLLMAGMCILFLFIFLVLYLKKTHLVVGT